MSSTTAVRADRVAGTIGAFKWILIGITLLGAGLYAQDRIFLSGADNAPTTGVVVAAGAVVCAVMIWLLFGWLEHTLRALAEITANTAGLRPQSFRTQPEQLQAPPALPGNRSLRGRDVCRIEPGIQCLGSGGFVLGARQSGIGSLPAAFTLPIGNRSGVIPGARSVGVRRTACAGR